MKKARKLPWQILAGFGLIAILFLDHYQKFTLKFPNFVTNILRHVTVPVSDFLVQIEYGVYDTYINNRVAAKQALEMVRITKELEQGAYEKGSPTYNGRVDALFSANPTSRDIVVAAIDEKTLTKLNSWPIRRDHYARFLNRLFEVGKARAVAFDIVFAEEGDKDTFLELKSLESKLPSPLNNEVALISERLNYNRALEDAFSRYRSQVVAGFSVLSDDEVAMKDLSQVYFPLDSIRYLWTKPEVKAQIRSVPGGVYNYAGVRDAVRHNAFFNVSPDSDGIVRRITLLNTIPVQVKIPAELQNSQEQIGYVRMDGQANPEVFASLGLETLNLVFKGLAAPVKVGSNLLMKTSLPFFVLNTESRQNLKEKFSALLLAYSDLNDAQRELLNSSLTQVRFQLGGGIEPLESAFAFNLIGEHKTLEGYIAFLESCPIEVLQAVLSDLPQNIREVLLTAEGIKSIANYSEQLKPLHQNFDKTLRRLLAEGYWRDLEQHLILMHHFPTTLREGLRKHFVQGFLQMDAALSQVFLERNFQKPENIVVMESDSRVGILYNSTRQGFVQYSMADIMFEDELEGLMLGFNTPKVTMEEAFRDRIVILGPTAQGINDWRATPVTKYMDGLEIHAHTIDTVRQSKQILRSDGANAIEFLLICVLAVVMPLVITRLNALLGALVAILLAGGWLGLCYTMLEYRALYYQFMPITVFVVCIYVYFTTYEYIMEEKEKRKTRDAFQHYVNASVVESVLANPDMLKLGGQKREMTVLFSDVRGFTTISEKLDATTLVALMNEYLEEMTNLVLESDGTLDKFIGDAVMAFWGAPLAQDDHPDRATKTAIAMLKKMETLSVDIGKKYDVEVAIGIGLNTGPMVVGNMGSKQRFNYTVLGDAVNLGARLEGQTKGYGAYLILSESTYNHVKDWVAGRFLDLIAVKGKSLPVKIYEVLGYKKEMSEEFLRGLKEFEDAIETYYFGRRFAEGVQVFKDLKKYRKGKDKACDLYIERCEDFAANPPDAEWDGSYVATSK